MTRERAIEILDKIPLCGFGCTGQSFTCLDCENAFLMAIEALKQPEIVRCKDCLWNEECKREGKTGGFDWYCADGERKDGDGDG